MAAGRIEAAHALGKRVVDVVNLRLDGGGLRHAMENIMQTMAWGLWAGERRTGAAGGGRALECGAAVLAMLMLAVMFADAWLGVGMAPSAPDRSGTNDAPLPAVTAAPGGREILIAGYAGAPLYYRSDVHMVRPNGTDLTLKDMGWDGDALYFPIDGGIRSIEWWGAGGIMIDFLHNKAISRLGKGAHGRKLANPVVEEVAAEGTLNGAPAPARIKLTDILERFEFTHGHNMLFFTALARPPALTPKVRPYFGIGAGFALPHVEVWFPGGKKDDRTSEYQFAGPAAQAVAGIEFRSGNWSYFFEYKFSWAKIAGAITGDESWLDFMMPGDLARQFGRWWRGEEPAFGRFETTLTAHQLVGGAGYWWRPFKTAAP